MQCRRTYTFWNVSAQQQLPQSDIHCDRKPHTSDTTGLAFMYQFCVLSRTQYSARWLRLPRSQHARLFAPVKWKLCQNTAADMYMYVACSSAVESLVCSTSFHLVWGKWTFSNLEIFSQMVFAAVASPCSHVTCNGRWLWLRLSVSIANPISSAILLLGE